MPRTTAGSPTQNTGRFFITLKPKSQRKASGQEIINRLRPELAKVQGAALFLQLAQDINVGGRLSRAQYQYTLQDSNLEELNSWAPRVVETLEIVAEILHPEAFTFGHEGAGWERHAPLRERAR